MGREVTPGPLSGGIAHPLAQDEQIHHTHGSRLWGSMRELGKVRMGMMLIPGPSMALRRAGNAPHLMPECGNAAGMGHRTHSLPPSPSTGGEEAPQSNKSTCTTRK